ncbi:MAG: HK97 family phage prohead protease [Pseudomonadota bacterium]
MSEGYGNGLERKFAQLGSDIAVSGGHMVEGYASYFGKPDQGRDIVQKGAYGRSLAELKAAGRAVKMLWQHDPGRPIGVWDEVREDDKGLYVKGRILADVVQGAEAISLLAAGAIDGLSIGYRTVKATKNSKGQRLLEDLELWEVSLVTFPMLPEARIGAKGDSPDDAVIRELAEVFRDARRMLAKT